MKARLPPYDALGSMRLRALLHEDDRLVEHDGFSWMRGQWIYEGIGFTWFGRLEDQPEITQGVEIAFDEISPEIATRILGALGLPLCPGMQLQQINEVLGQIETTVRFVPDRATYNFRVGTPESYQVGCTVHETDGLIHVSLIRSDTRRRLAVA
jgi:hypothetical protein